MLPIQRDLTAERSVFKELVNGVWRLDKLEEVRHNVDSGNADGIAVDDTRVVGVEGPSRARFRSFRFQFREGFRPVGCVVFGRSGLFAAWITDAECRRTT